MFFIVFSIVFQRFSSFLKVLKHEHMTGEHEWKMGQLEAIGC